ncbi:MAG: conjugal transfer protein TrbI [Scytonema sp. PMC 1070.18]|nr:conjugal transfer protein TrbI [Scytonema sp. PMC 1070.18]
MLITKLLRSRTALLMALGITSTVAVPIMSPTPAIADNNPYVIGQGYRRDYSSNIPAGTRIPVQYDEAEKIVVTPGETTDITLTVAQNIRSSDGRVVIPAGSEIRGELQPADNVEGTRFVAQELILRNSDRSIPINATSRTVTRVETVTRRSDPDFLKGAAVGAAAGAVLGEIFGDIDFIEVLGGAGLGVVGALLTRGSEEAEVAVVYPERDLDLTLRDNLVLSSRY